MCAINFAITFSHIHAEQFQPTAAALSWQQILSYRPADDAWCNTLLTDAVLDRNLLHVPAGIGLSFILETESVSTPLKSQYILLTDEGHDILRERIRVKRILKTDVGSLYQNLDAGCNYEGSP